MDKLREALKKDFAALYVKRYTTHWEIERMVRSIEITNMEFTNTLALIEQIRKEEREWQSLKEEQ